MSFRGRAGAARTNSTFCFRSPVVRVLFPYQLLICYRIKIISIASTRRGRVTRTPFLAFSHASCVSYIVRPFGFFAGPLGEIVVPVVFFDFDAAFDLVATLDAFCSFAFSCKISLS